MMTTYEKKLLASREWKKRNKEKVASYQKEWRENNIDKRKEAKKEGYESNKERAKTHNKEFITKNPLYHVNKHLQSTYGISLEEYTELLEKQNHQCAGCGIEATKTPRQKLYVDHCHKTEKVRGLLCQHCNTALGMAKDSIETLSKLISYLKQENN